MKAYPNENDIENVAKTLIAKYSYLKSKTGGSIVGKLGKAALHTRWVTSAVKCVKTVLLKHASMLKSVQSFIQICQAQEKISTRQDEEKQITILKY